MTYQTIHHGDLIITEKNAKIYTNLERVTGYVDIREGATFIASVLAKSDYIYVREGATFIAPMLNPEIEIFREIFEFSGRVLFASQKGNYKSGCNGPWSAAVCKKMAKVFGEEYGDEIKEQFLSAINKHEAEINGAEK